MTTALQKYLLKSSTPPQPRRRSSSIVTFKPPHSTSLSTHKTLTSSQPRSRYHTLTPSSLTAKQQQLLTNIYSKKQPSNKNRYLLHPLRRLQPVKLQKRPPSSTSSASYLSLSSSRTKLTDRYFRQIEDMKMVERLLLVRPTKEICKKEHQQFYNLHIKYRNNMLSNKSVPFKEAGVRRAKKYMDF